LGRTPEQRIGRVIQQIDFLISVANKSAGGDCALQSCSILIEGCDKNGHIRLCDRQEIVFLLKLVDVASIRSNYIKRVANAVDKEEEVTKKKHNREGPIPKIVSRVKKYNLPKYEIDNDTQGSNSCNYSRYYYVISGF
jgi:hypothetical protein